jgi:hypothetical protein
MKTKLQSLIIAALFLISAGFVNAQEWEKYFSGYNYIYTALEFPENQSLIGYAAGGHVTWNGNGIVIKTTDGGDTWTSMWTGNNQGIEGMSFPTVNTGFVVGFSGYFGKTDFEGSDGIPAGWTVYNQAGSATWVISENNNHTPGGSKSALHNYASGLQDGWLVTPQISMPTEGFFYLTFWDFNGDPTWYGKNSVLVSTGSPDPADNEYVEVWTVSEVTNQWLQVAIDLEAYAGEDIYIAFRYEGNFAHFWFVDDISLGEELNTNPIMVVTPEEIEQSVAQTGTSTNRINIHNEGLGSLTFNVEVDYIDEDGWLTVDPVSGSVNGNSTQIVNLTFNGMGLDFGAYTATITVTSDDPENPEVIIPVTMNVIDVSPVNLVILQNMYTFPVAISENGQHVVGTPFGGQSGYYWSEESGVVNFAAYVNGVSNTGEVVVTYNDPELLYNGNPVQVAGRWSFAHPEFEFLGMNPAVPEFFMTDYNNSWGISSDGIIVGMQYSPPYQYKAFSWTEEDGYDNIGDHPSLQGNRPNGINASGEVVYGWGVTSGASRSPLIWYNNEIIFIDETAWGEANAASPNNLYVTGTRGSEGFLWNSGTGATIYFENTLNPGSINPAAVTNDGWIFGYTAEGFPALPPGRRAFVRNPGGVLTTFNDYAEGRGWFDAADWTFYAISGVSGDGNRFIGAGIDRDGNDVSFMIDFEPAQPVIEVDPLSLSETLDMGQNSEQTLEISNTGVGGLNYNAVIQYVADDAKVQEVPVGRSARNRSLELGKKEGTDGFHPATKANDKNDIILNYDGANVDAIGLVAGGTFYGAARYTSEMVAPFGGYLLESVDVYIGGVPTEITLMIWDAGTTTTPGALLHEQVFTPSESSWNTVTLDETLEVTGADLWVGFKITHPAGVYVLGIDGGPANPNGDLLSTDAVAWEHLSDYGLNGNWNIRARLQYEGVQWLTINPASGTIAEDQSQTVTVNFDATGLEPGTYNANIRISNNSVNEQLVIVPVTLVVSEPVMYTLTLLVNPEDAGVVTGAGTYAAGTVVTVNAVAHEGYEFVNWTDPDDNIVSEAAENEITITGDLTLIANFLLINNVTDVWENQLTIYPNPASDVINFMSNDNIRGIELFNLTGQKVYATVVNYNHYKLDVSGLPQGFYLVRLTNMEGEIHTTRILIAR